jgi:hypothetical protein
MTLKGKIGASFQPIPVVIEAVNSEYATNLFARGFEQQVKLNESDAMCVCMPLGVPTYWVTIRSFRYKPGEESTFVDPAEFFKPPSDGNREHQI